MPGPNPNLPSPAIGATTRARALLWAQTFISAHVGPGHYPVSRLACLTEPKEGYTSPHLWAGWRYTCQCGATYDAHWVGDDGCGLDLFQTDHASLEIALLEAAGQPLP